MSAKLPIRVWIQRKGYIWQQVHGDDDDDGDGGGHGENSYPA